MTTLWVQPLALTCDSCGTAFVFPQDQACPRCGEPLLIRARPDLGILEAPSGDPGPDREGGGEIDGAARQILLIGIGLCAGLIVLALVGEGLLLPLANSAGIPDPVYRFLRLGLLLGGAFGFLRGCASLLGWRSGRYWYRRIRRF